MTNLAGEARDPYELPPFGRDVALDACLRDCPRSMTTRGTFFTAIERHARGASRDADDRLYDGLAGRQWTAFKSYPLTEFMQLAHNAARICYPALPTGEGLRRLGWLSFQSFAATMAGRVVLYSMGVSVEDLVWAASKSYDLGLPGSSVTVVPLGQKHFRFEMRQVFSFADTYHVGVIEGGLRSLGVVPQIRVRLHRKRCDVDLDVQWRGA